MKKIDKSIKKMEFISQWISNVDTKSSFVLTFFGVIITIICTSDIGEDMIDTFSYEKAGQIEFESIKLFLSLLIVIGFFISIFITIFHVYKTLVGRIDSNIYSQTGLNTNSNIFFKTIALKEFADYETQSNTESKGDFLNDINSQVFINSKIADKKFKHYNKSLIWTIISFSLFIIFMIIK